MRPGMQGGVWPLGVRKRWSRCRGKATSRTEARERAERRGSRSDGGRGRGAVGVGDMEEGKRLRSQPLITCRHSLNPSSSSASSASSSFLLSTISSPPVLPADW